MQSVVPGLLAVALLAMDTRGSNPAAAVPPARRETAARQRTGHRLGCRLAERTTDGAAPAFLRAGRRVSRARRPRHRRRRRFEAQRHERGRRRHLPAEGPHPHRRSRGVAPLHAIMIEMKQDAPGGDDPSPDLPPAFPRDGAKQLLDNERVRIWDYAFLTGRVGPLHRHVRDAVVVWMADGRLRSMPRDGAPTVTTLTKFTATYSRRGNVHTEEAIEGAPRAYVFELK